VTRPAEPICIRWRPLLAAIVSLAVSVSSSVHAADPPAASPPSRRAPLEEAIDDVGLWKSTVEPGSLDRGEAGLEDPAEGVLDREDSESEIDGEGQGGEESGEESGEEGDPPRGEPFVAPIPFRSPSLGWGGALAGGYIFRIDREDLDSPPSTASLAGFGAENESFGGVVSFRGHLARDLWRVSSTAAVARVNYDFFGIGSDAGAAGDKIGIEAKIVIGFLEVLRRLPDSVELFGEPLYLGPNVRVSRTDNSLTSGSLPPGVSASELDETRVAFGAHLQRDTRDDTFYPTEGSLSDFTFSFLEGAFGSDFDYRVWDVSYSRFDSLWQDGVLAGRVFGRFTDGDVPFTDLSAHDLRGYERGRYRDRMHLATELEVRQHLFWRLGAAVFAGLGQVAPAVDEFDTDRILWSAGLGLRFQLTEQNRMNYRTDVAWGRDGFEFYFSITEAF
jgi:hypothetical protein